MRKQVFFNQVLAKSIHNFLFFLISNIINRNWSKLTIWNTFITSWFKWIYRSCWCTHCFFLQRSNPTPSIIIPKCPQIISLSTSIFLIQCYNTIIVVTKLNTITITLNPSKKLYKIQNKLPCIILRILVIQVYKNSASTGKKTPKIHNCNTAFSDKIIL